MADIYLLFPMYELYFYGGITNVSSEQGKETAVCPSRKKTGGNTTRWREVNMFTLLVLCFQVLRL